MNNAWDEIRNALVVARDANNAANYHANQMAQLLRGRLQNVSVYVLADLKRELRDFNIHTKEWK